MAKKKTDEKHSYETDIVLGELYIDTQTGYEGIATSIHFYQHACERVTLEAFESKTKQVRELTFDSPRLQHAKTKKQATTTKTGGPARAGERREEVQR